MKRILASATALLVVAGCSAANTDPVLTSSSPTHTSASSFLSERNTYKWTVLKALGDMVYARFGRVFPYAFDEHGRLLTPTEMDAGQNADGSPVVQQQVQNAIIQMFFKLTGSTDTPGYQPGDDVPGPTESSPPRR